MIDEAESFILTGGIETQRNATRYDKDGFVAHLPILLEGRFGHACSGYVDDTGSRVNMVAGGWNGMSVLDTCERSIDDGDWSVIAALPLKIEFLQGATLDNSIFVMGMNIKL